VIKRVKQGHLLLSKCHLHRACTSMKNDNKIKSRHENEIMESRQRIVELEPEKDYEQGRYDEDQGVSEILRSISGAITIIRVADRCFIEASSLFLKGMGYSRHEVIGHSVEELGLWVDEEDRRRFIDRLRDQGRVRGLEVKMYSKSREIRELLLSADLVEIHGEQYIVARAIYKHGQPEEALLGHQGQLEKIIKKRTERIQKLERQRTEIEKLAAAGLIAAKIAHEINNPLAGIKNSFLLIKDAIPADHPYHRYVGRIEKEIDRISRIVRQVFDVYRPRENRATRIEMERTIDDVVSLLEPAWREKEVKIEVAVPPMVLMIDEASLVQVIYNILINAIEASPQGGIVKVTGEIDEGILFISISDQGPGIPETLRPHIFEPLFTTKHDSDKGVGLGLSIPKNIVEKMGGVIGFECGREGGSIFRIIVPITNPGKEVEHDWIRSYPHCRR